MRTTGLTRTTTFYWTTTALVAAESLGGGLADLLRAPPFYPAMIALGYPPYLATIMGAAKLVAAVIVLAPALPRLKEWAYAGILITLIGAVASHVATRDSPAAVIAPAAFAGLALLSWHGRPASRRLDAHPPGAAVGRGREPGRNAPGLGPGRADSAG
ncbi:DoxX family protein [Amorphoplanes nipponensis]|uniref:Membrane protein n=1 Tax=Actinoplanes nipponensis TaxID=135950 RepID=A0A919JMD4_9ACTN|nr:DoxX family protein [Actinoplanes nipponensis]GIE53699.1 membrane protein [Actinoplanes nipponensis]